MARGNWEDFTDKFGFNDGDSAEGRDFRARDILVRLLNEQPESKATRTRAVAFDRPGCHNACLILLAKDVPGLLDEDFLGAVLSDRTPEVDLPDFETYLGDLIRDAYDEADESPEK